jgi:hypothetical protein
MSTIKRCWKLASKFIHLTSLFVFPQNSATTARRREFSAQAKDHIYILCHSAIHTIQPFSIYFGMNRPCFPVLKRLRSEDWLGWLLHMKEQRKNPLLSLSLLPNSNETTQMICIDTTAHRQTQPSPNNTTSTLYYVFHFPSLTKSISNYPFQQRTYRRISKSNYKKSFFHFYSTTPLAK